MTDWALLVESMGKPLLSDHSVNQDGALSVANESDAVGPSRVEVLTAGSADGLGY